MAVTQEIIREALDSLKQVLQSEKDSSKLEHLAAALFGALLDVPIAVAKSGFQHGGDAGPVGRQHRRFRIECKNYGDNTRLSDRELLGEIDQALARDKALEAWILVTTRAVPEQLEQDLVQKGERIGVPVIIVDWKAEGLPALAALCAFAPDIVREQFSEDAGISACVLEEEAKGAIAGLKRSLETWCLGFESIRAKSHNRLIEIWTSPRSSTAALGQNAAGGDDSHRLRRASVHDALTSWWDGAGKNDAPAAVIGWDGVGKTWAAIDWLNETAGRQPIVLIVPSSAVSATIASEIAVKRFFAERLYEVSGVREPEHWFHRLEYLLRRPVDEGPVLTILFDGLNQEPSAPWVQLFKLLQLEVFAGRFRIVLTTRRHHFDDRLSQLRGLVIPAERITVDVFSLEPGGEFDQRLALEGLSRSDLHPDLIQLARTPRLFRLVLRFRDRLIEAGQVTLHRLLWEYGRDTFGDRAGKSFSEEDWRAWLKEIAQHHQKGVREYSMRSLSETASRPDLTTSQVYARLSDIIDGRFAQPNQSGTLQLSPVVVAHALGSALLSQLDSIAQPTFDRLEEEINQWLDPISGLDERAEILRATVSILVERGSASDAPVAGVLTTAWLQTQNVDDAHRRELASLAPDLVEALLDAVEHSNQHTHASARLWAVNALRAVPRSDASAIKLIIARAQRWVGQVPRNPYGAAGEDLNQRLRRSEHLKARIGSDEVGPFVALGVRLELVEGPDHGLALSAGSALQGFPLTPVIPVLETLVLAYAINSHSEGWDCFKWLCLLNEVDHDETTTALRRSSAEFRSRLPEAGLHPELPARAAALMLWLTGYEDDELEAASINPPLDNPWTYEKDYLADPSKSIFALERRHAHAALKNRDIALHNRIQRAEKLILDPTFEPPSEFVDEIRDIANRFDISTLNRVGSYTLEDRQFEQLLPVLARCAPDLLTELGQRFLQTLAARPSDQRYWSARVATDYFLIAGKLEREAARQLRLSGTESLENEEFFTSSQLLLLELSEEHPSFQYETLINAHLSTILTSFSEILGVPTSEDVDRLIDTYGQGTPNQRRTLLLLLSFHTHATSEKTWQWIESFTGDSDEIISGVAFRTLARIDALKLGRWLLEQNWSWSALQPLWVNHYGTEALIQAGASLPFEQLATRLAPWRLLECAKRRGANPNEVRFAAEILELVLTGGPLEVPDPGSTISIDRNPGHFLPLTIDVKPRRSSSDDSDGALKHALDMQARVEEFRRATKTAAERIADAHKAGACLYVTDIEASDFDQVVRHAPDMIERWIEGYAEPTHDFKRRVQLSEAAYLGLTEAMLASDPELGVQLWRAVRTTLITRFVGAAGVDELIHIVFRAPDSPAVAKLRQELLDLEHSSTDERLFELGLAALQNGNVAWWNASVEQQTRETAIWKQKRGLTMSGFTVGAPLPVAGAWLEGPTATDNEEIQLKSARRRSIDACARHWWRIYLRAADSSSAFAAWILFLQSIDRRAKIWMDEEIQAADDGTAWFKRKLSHAQLNYSDLKSAMDKREDKLDRTFLYRNVVDELAPWGVRTR